MLKKGAIVPSVTEPGEFVSTLFIVPKPNGKYRPVINLRYLNDFIHYDHFKQETFKVVLDLLQQNDYLTSVDLQDAYFSIPIHEDDQKFLKFRWNGILYKFQCVCFGLKSAPYLFTKVLKPVFAFFRQQNMRCSYYIDDSLNMNKDKVVCQSNTMSMVHKLESLGFTVNYSKSALLPSQRILFFGFIIDSVEFKVFLPEEKICKILSKAKMLLEKRTVVVRELASFIGLIVNAFYAVLEAPLFYRGLERNKLRGLGVDNNFDNEVVLSDTSIEELTWWCNNVVVKNGKHIRPQKAQKRCRTDASFLGWGAVDLDSKAYANGRWDVKESDNWINYLELLAVFFALESLFHTDRNVHIEIQSDNVVAIKYINDMGGITSNTLDLLAKKIWLWCLDRNIFVTAVFIPGVQNTADFYSRNFSDETEWMLKKDIFARICKQFFVPDIDMFASRLNKQTDRFVSWFPEPGALFSDAFTISWKGYLPYAFPPFSLVGKVINKIIRDGVEKAILIFPLWKSQPWFPLLLESICSFPVRLPRHKDLLVLAHNQECHPLARRMKIVAVIISGRPCMVEEFRRQLQTSSSPPGALEQGNSINQPGKGGVLGTVLGVPIPFRRLRL